jgi:peptidoglycan/xylan/chitin deacetylase (PgdA/CDA1 family)
VVATYSARECALVGTVICAINRLFTSLPRTITLCYALCLLDPRLLAAANSQFQIPILVYHRFGARAADSMTVTVSLFESHLKYLRDNGYQAIPLRQFVEFRSKGGPELPRRAVVITADDGHHSVYTQLLPLARKYSLPVTLFIYPSAISNADYAMTWEQLADLKQTGLFDIQSHSFWHPNFNDEKRRLKHEQYEKFVRTQLVKSKQTLEKKLQTHVDMLAWPFGIFDDDLIGKAREAGYQAAFTIEGRHTTSGDSIMALPRYLVTQAFQMKVFAELMGGKPVKVKKDY